MVTTSTAVDQVVEADPGPLRRFRRGRSLSVLLIAPVALVALGLWGLGRGGAYGYDEAASRWAALLPLRSLFRLLSHVDAVHGLYYLGLHAWAAFGHGPVALRLPSLLASAAAAAVVTALGRSLGGSMATGLVAGLLYAVSPFVMFYAQTARSFAIVSLLVAAATLVLVRVLDAELDGAARSLLARRWASYAALVGLAGWLNELSLLVLAAHGVTMVVAGRPRQAIKHWFGAAAVAVTIVSPLAAISMTQTSVVARDHTSLHRIGFLIGHLFGPHPAVMLVTISCAVVALLPGRRARPTRLVAVALPLLVIPPTLLAIEAAVGQPLFGARYLLYTVIGAVLLVAQGAVRLGRTLFENRTRAAALAPAIGAGVVVFAFVAQIPYAEHIRTADSRTHNFLTPASYIGAEALPGDGVLFFDSFFRMVRLTYPEDFRGVRDIALAEGPAASGSFHGVDAPLATVRERILRYHRIWEIGLPPSLHRLGPGYLAQIRLLSHDFYPLDIRYFEGEDVTLWIRRGNEALFPNT